MSARAFASMFESWIDDPVLFCDDVFTMRPREWQPAFLRSVARNTVKRRSAIKACRDAGKTAAASYLVLWWLCTRPHSLVVTTANTWSQVEESLWVEIRKLWWSSKLPRLFPKWEVLQVGIKTGDPEWRAFGMSSDHAENFEGPHGRSVLVVYDEAKRVDPMVYEMLQGLLTNIEWREVAISTPGPTAGWFYDAFTKDADLWDLHSINAYEIPRLTPTAQAAAFRLGEANGMYRQQWLAEFSSAETGAMFPFSIIEPCVNLKFDPAPTQQQIDLWPRIMGVDPAGTGTDEFAVCLRHGPIVEDIQAWAGWDEMQSVGEVVNIARRWKAQKVIVEKPGLGGPIISALREQLGQRMVEEFNPGERAFETETYDNLKTEIAFGLRDRMAHMEIRLKDDGRLKGQLASYTVGRSPRGLTKLMDAKNAGSPDRADAMLCAFANDFQRPSVATEKVQWL